MTKYIYCFGYKTDSMLLDDDAETNGVFVILSQDEASALEWGRELSRWYVRSINKEPDAQVWRPDYYANWIERRPRAELQMMVEQSTPVKPGEYPSLDAARVIFRDCQV